MYWFFFLEFQQYLLCTNFFSSVYTLELQNLPWPIWNQVNFEHVFCFFITLQNFFQLYLQKYRISMFSVPIKKKALNFDHFLSKICGIRSLLVYIVDTKELASDYLWFDVHFNILVERNIHSKLRKEFVSEVCRAGRGTPRIWILLLLRSTHIFKSSFYSL